MERYVGPVLPIEFPFAELDNKAASEKAMQHGMTVVCALLNSGGGILRLYSTNIVVFSVDKLVKKFEQKLKDLLGSYGSCTLFKVVTVVPDKEVVFEVQSSPTLCTLNYHLYLPSEAQINLILANERITNIHVIVDAGTKVSGHLIQLGSHHQDFVLDARVRSRESKTEQYKLLKEESTKNISIADRIVGKSAKLKQTVSAFANYMGGHVYFGIKDDGEVKGERLRMDTKKVQLSIVRKIEKAIRGMTWPTNPIRGKQWDVFFEPVRQNNVQLPDVFVIVLTVVRCAGGVFEQAPESYCLVDNEVILMPFGTWLQRLRNSGRSELDVGNHVCPNRPQANQLHVNTRKELARLRNNGDVAGFNNAAKRLMENHPGDDIRIIIRQQQAACAYRLNNFTRTLSLLSENTALLSGSNQHLRLLLVENLYWESLAHNCLKNSEISEQLRSQAMQISEEAAPDIIVPWLHYQQGRAFERKIQENFVNNFQMIEEAKTCYDLVLRKVTSLPEMNSQAELKFRVYTRLAMITLGCFFSENETTWLDVAHLDENAIRRAGELLQAVDMSSKCNGIPMSRFCRAEYLLARSVQIYRCWETYHKDTSYLDDATDEISSAHKICVAKEFNELLNFVNSHMQRIKGSKVSI